MIPHSVGNLMTAIAALAVAGIVTCGGALLDLRTDSLEAFLAKSALLGLMVATAAIGYVWVCGKCEGCFHDRLDRLLRGGTANRKHSGAARVAHTSRPHPTGATAGRGRLSRGIR
jgi:hypothetical protein